MLLVIVTSVPRGEKQQVNRGGVATPGGYLYELSGGALCLDFANTLDSRPTARPRELLPDYAHLVGWGIGAGAVPARVGRLLRAASERDPDRAAASLDRALAAREAIFRLFSAQALGETRSRAALDTLNDELRTAVVHLRLAFRGDAFRWRWDDDAALDRILWPVVRSASDLLTSDDLDRVRLCAADDCDWLFLDQSRNRSRRWCDMTVCGNRDKVRRFRRARSAG